MSLVLLDEMNLARVEYYFSEFLSKLEIRRDVDAEDAPGRRSAEVEFDTGLRADGSAVRIFPSGNVLYVGTMNEDETTQALSDKVVDRANLLRFGKPPSLASSADSNQDLYTEEVSALSYDCWNTWIAQSKNSIDAQRQNKMADWLERLNGALGTIKRPFGHRVSLGIEQYVEMYPGNPDEKLICGFGDQIEQRIIPKLRGLDCHDGKSSQALEQIMDVISELNDEPLTKAFDIARSEDLFLWQGVERS
jgi:hypothetical protein